MAQKEKTIEIPADILKAENITYDNSDSTLKATKIKGAIDELDKKAVLLDTQTTTDTTLRNSKAGGIRVIGIDGNSIQNGEPTTDNTQEIVSFGECVEMINGDYYYSGVYSPSPASVCNKYHIPCKEGDVIKVCTERALKIRISLYNNGSFVSLNSSNDNTNSYSVTVPNGCDSFRFYIHNASGNLTPQTAGKITLTVNGKYVVPIKTRGKNLLDCSGLVETTINGVKFTPVCNSNGDLEYVNVNGNSSGTAIYHLTQSFAFKEDKSYKVSGCPSGGSESTHQLRIYDGSSVAFGDIGNGADISNFNCNNAQVFIRIGAGTVCNNLKFYPMISEEGGEYASYTEHTEYIYLNEPPRKVGDVADRIVEKDGLWGVVRDVIKEDDWTSYVMFNSETHIITFQLHSDSTNPRGYLKSLCTHFSRVNSGSELTKAGLFYIWESKDWSGARVAFKLGDEITTGEEALAYLQELSVELFYPSKTPTFELLDKESQKALRRLLSYDDVTYIDFDSTIPPSKIEVEYGTSKVGALSLENANLREILELSVKEMESNKLSTTDIYATTLVENWIINPTYGNSTCIVFETPLGSNYKPLCITGATSSNSLAVVTSYNVDGRSGEVCLSAKNATEPISGTVTVTVLMIKDN